jgi:hypothetical protein
LGDGGILIGPVGAEEDCAGVTEVLLDVGAIKDEALVDLAGKAPAGGEVDEDGFALGSGLGEERGGEGLPVGRGRLGWDYVENDRFCVT